MAEAAEAAEAAGAASRDRPATEPRDPWDPVLDDLEHRVRSAEAGDLAALDGWEPPAVQPQPMTADAQHRANGILARQRALLRRLREEQQATAAAMRSLRRPQYKQSTAPPVYVDRVG